ncbi:LysR family transcriptional regulator (plasmid) [Paroceanicella profunda]|uniref:LysR family transcriptional regulator n=1 Tax=Paroceanicella profunda TaxID=2579971 RepID=A0A5B8FJC1_9RHOB|nr:LysR family transcriptional regulator [Paroceanicella profunda]QDL94108.1 LysR family transcriptional regulator [Paroceanicella profunda]
MDRIDAMAALLEVVRSGSFSAAARQLGQPTTSLTRRITELEGRLGARLLTRTTRSVTLTDAGAVYVAAARRIVEDVEEAERAVAGEYLEPRGELVVTAPAMFGRIHVVPIVAAFLAAYPKIDIRLLLTDAVLPLAETRVDVAIRIGDMPDTSLIARKVGGMRIVICGSDACLERYGTPSVPQDLTALPTIAVGPAGQRQLWRFAAEAKRDVQLVPIAPRLSVTTTDAAVEAAVLGVGLTQQRLYQVADRLASGALTLCLQPFEVDPAPVHVLHLPGNHLPLKARRFLDFAVPRLRDGLKRLEALG